LRNVAAGSGVTFVGGLFWGIPDWYSPVTGNKTNIRAELFAIKAAIDISNHLSS